MGALDRYVTRVIEVETNQDVHQARPDSYLKQSITISAAVALRLEAISRKLDLPALDIDNEVKIE